MAGSIPDQIGPYRVEAELGRGGMGIVYLATQRGLDRPVALKVLDPGKVTDPDFAARFHREATTLAKVDSPHIIAIYDHGLVDDVLYLATQYVAGGDLSALVARRGPLPQALALELFGQVLKGLRDAHQVGVIHRDIKPANILVRAGDREPHIYLCDFGIAQAGEVSQLTQQGFVAGSPGFMAPERNEGYPATVGSDLYSAACVLWVLLSGHNLYEGTDFQVAMQHATGPIPQVAGAGPLSGTINQVLRLCLAKDPAARPESAEAVLQLLPGASQPVLADADPLTKYRPREEVPATVIRQTGPTPTRVAGPEPTVAPLAPVSVSAVPAPPAGIPSAPPADAAAPPAAPAATPPHSRAPGRTGLLIGIGAGLVAIVLLLVFGLPRLVGGQGTVAAQGLPTSTSAAAGGPAAAPPPATTVAQGLFTCWDGTTQSDLADCGGPSGDLGLAYVFPSVLVDDPRCVLNSPLIDRKPGTISYRCDYPEGFVLYRYWADGGGARKHFKSQYTGSPVLSDLVLDGESMGFQYRGRLKNGDYCITAALINSHFTVSAASPYGPAERNQLFNRVQFRAVANLVGFPEASRPGIATRG